MLGGQQRHIYRDDFELLHDGMQRLARQFSWTVIERPSEVDPEALPDPRLITLEKLGLERLRPVPEPPAPPEVMACETCVNRTNATGDGPCLACDLTFDGPQSNYCAESDEPLAPEVAAALALDDSDRQGSAVEGEDLDAFAARSAAGNTDDGETPTDDGDDET